MFVSLLKSLVLLLLLTGWIFHSGWRAQAMDFFGKMESILAKRKLFILWAVFFIYCVINLFLQLNHEVGGDEAQAWLLARDTVSLSEFFRYTHYEGSPALWHLVLFPFTKLRLPFETIYVINFIIVTGAVAVFLFYAPVPLLLRIVLPFTYMLLWEYGVFARSYALTCLLLFAGLAVYDRYPAKWLGWGLLFLLCANSNFTATILTGAFLVFLLFAKDKKYKRQRLYGGLLVAAGILLSLWQVVPTPPDISVRDHYVFRPYLNFFTHVITTGYEPLSGMIYLLVCALLIVAFRNRALVFSFLAGQVALFLFFALIFTARPRHHLFFFLGMLMAVWLARAKNGSWVFIFFIALFMTGPAINFSRQELAAHTHYPKELARFLQTEQAGKKTMICSFTDYVSLPVAAYLPGTKFYFPKGDRWGTFCIWDTLHASKQFNPAKVIQVAAIKHRFAGYEKYLFLSYVKLNTDSLEQYGIRLLTEKHETVNRRFSRANDDYYLYDLGN
jgi:hypothetical protein